jgi:hypothetical protein
MTDSDLNAAAGAVLRRAQQQGYVVPRDIRSELKDAGQPESRWKEVVEILRESLNYRHGRYYYLTTSEPRRRAEPSGPTPVRRAVEELLKRQAAAAGDERREQPRSVLVTSLKVQTDDGREFTVLSRDLSATGIRLITQRSLLGQKLRVFLPQPDGAEPPTAAFVRIVWTSATAEGLFENGGTFIDG